VKLKSGEPEMAFRTARKDKIFEAVQALKDALGLSQGSVSASGNRYAAYDFYKLLTSYINDPEARLKINSIIEESEANTRSKS
jgi:hypothetical protein